MNGQYKQILIHASAKKNGSHWGDPGEVKKTDNNKRGGGSSWDETISDKIRSADPFKKLSDYAYTVRQENDNLREKGIDPYSKSQGYLKAQIEKGWRGQASDKPSSKQSSKVKSGKTRYSPEPKDMWTGSEESIKSDIVSNGRTWASKSWGNPNSQDFKDTKKEYNEWYYRTHKDKWKKDGNGAPKVSIPSSATANMYKNKAYEEAGKAYGQAMANAGKTHVDAITYNPAYERGKSALNSTNNFGVSKTSLTDLWKSGAKSILNAGKSLLNKISSLFS